MYIKKNNHIVDEKNLVLILNKKLGYHFTIYFFSLSLLYALALYFVKKKFLMQLFN